MKLFAFEKKSKIPKNVFVSLLCICAIFVFKSTHVHAAGIFPKSSYTLPCQKDMLLWGKSLKACENFVWQSSNTEIAEVNSWGIVHAKQEGTCEITATNTLDNTKSVCTLHVSCSDPVRSVWAEPPIGYAHKQIYLHTLTNTNISSVKFEISGPGYSKTVYAKNGTPKGNYLSWQEPICSPAAGIYTVKVQTKTNDTWKTCPEAYGAFTITRSTNKLECTYEKKGISNECVEFIASCEGFVSHVYKDITGSLTIGYGKRIWPFSPFYNNMDKKEGLSDLLRILNQNKYISSVNDMLTKNNLKFSQCQLDALVSFSFNLGRRWITDDNRYLKQILVDSGKKTGRWQGTVNSSNGLFVRESPDVNAKKLTVLVDKEKVNLFSCEKTNNDWYHVETKKGVIGYCYHKYLNIHQSAEEPGNLNCINKEEFIKEFLSYHHAGGKCLKALLRRRITELNIFFQGNYSRRTGLRNYPLPKCVTFQI